MELIHWSFSAIDKLFSTRRVGPHDPKCPDGTFPSGYVMDSWDTWRAVCLTILDVEDVEDVYLCVFLILGLLGLGMGLFEIWKTVRKNKLELSILKSALEYTNAQLARLMSCTLETRAIQGAMQHDISKTREGMAIDRAVAAATDKDEP